jgi:hypothetical protein
MVAPMGNQMAIVALAKLWWTLDASMLLVSILTAATIHQNGTAATRHGS